MNGIPKIETPISEKTAREMNPVVLAFVGDSVYSLAVRVTLATTSDRKSGALHRDASQVERAERQAQVAMEIAPLLTDEERSIFQRGRNAKTAHSAKNATAPHYHLATGIEALVGYLYLTGNTARLNELFGREFGCNTDNEL